MRPFRLPQPSIKLSPSGQPAENSRPQVEAETMVMIIPTGLPCASFVNVGGSDPGPWDSVRYLESAGDSVIMPCWGLSGEAFTTNRLSKITTRTGDEGLTSLADGTRVKKDSVYMEAIGAVDELNSALGILLAKALPDGVRALLLDVQNDLFDLGAELCYPGYRCLAPVRLEALDHAIAELNSRLAPLREFVLPGGSEAGALCHFVRTVCRAAERRVVSFCESHPPGSSDLKIPYLNRLSDLLFVLARIINQHDGAAETCWTSPASRGKQGERG